MTILVVDDDYSIRDMLTQLLEDEGYTVVCANDGQEALSYLRQTEQPPRLILLDLMMPRMNGWQFREVQRQDPLLSNIPVVILSAGTDLQKQATLMEVSQYIGKPINLQTLLQIVEHHCL